MSTRDRRTIRRNATPTRARSEPLEPRVLLSMQALGDEFRVTASPLGEQWKAAGGVASDAAGNTAFVWTTNGSTPTGGVFIRRFDPAGQPLGDQQYVNVNSGFGGYGEVDMNARGDTVVTWTSVNGPTDVWARAYDPSGRPRGTAIRCNTTLVGNQQFSDVSVAEDGSYVVVWGSDQDGGRAIARRFGATGTPLTGEIPLTGPGDGNGPAIVSAADGSFVAVWGSTPDRGTAHARRFNAAGEPVGPEVRVASAVTPDGGAIQPTIAGNPDGTMVIAWTAYDPLPGHVYDVFARVLDKDLNGLGPQFRVHSVNRGNDSGGALDVAPDGSFVVTWATSGDAADPADPDFKTHSIYARRFFADGQPDGPDVKVNTVNTRPFNINPGVAIDADGDTTVFFAGGNDNYLGGDLFARRYTSDPAKLPPAARVGPVSPDPRATPVDELRVRFSEPVTGVDTADFSLTRDGGPNLLTDAQTLTKVDDTTWTLSGLSGLTAAPGEYVLTVKATGSGIADAGGNPLTADATGAWHTTPPDVTPPTAQVTLPFRPEDSYRGLPGATVTFSEPVSGFDASDLRLTLDGTAVPLEGLLVTAVGDNRYTVMGLPRFTDRNGHYVLSVAAAGSGIADPSGNAMAADASAAWVVNLPAPGVFDVILSRSTWNQSFLTALSRVNNAYGYSFRFDPANQLTDLPWSVDTVTVWFSEEVVYPTDGSAKDFLEVHGVNVPTYAISDFTHNPGSRLATWRLATPIGADRVTLRVRSDLVHGIGTGRNLDGEHEDGAPFPSGNDAPGGDFVFHFNVLPGDANRDGRVNAVDLARVRARQLSAENYDVFSDLDGNAAINAIDLGLARANQLHTLPAVQAPQTAPVELRREDVATSLVTDSRAPTGA